MNIIFAIYFIYNHFQVILFEIVCTETTGSLWIRVLSTFKLAKRIYNINKIYDVNVLAFRAEWLEHWVCPFSHSFWINKRFQNKHQSGSFLSPERFHLHDPSSQRPIVWGLSFFQVGRIVVFKDSSASPPWGTILITYHCVHQIMRTSGLLKGEINTKKL